MKPFIASSFHLRHTHTNINDLNSHLPANKTKEQTRHKDENSQHKTQRVKNSQLLKNLSIAAAEKPYLKQSVQIKNGSRTINDVTRYPKRHNEISSVSEDHPHYTVTAGLFQWSRTYSSRDFEGNQIMPKAGKKVKPNIQNDNHNTRYEVSDNLLKYNSRDDDLQSEKKQLSKNSASQNLEKYTLSNVQNNQNEKINCKQRSKIKDNHGKTKIAFEPVRKNCFRHVVILCISSLVLVAVTVGVGRLRNKPTVHVVFPASTLIRKVRMFSDFPDLRQLSKNHSSLSLVSRLQLLDTKRCKDDLDRCQLEVVCDASTGQNVNCRCRTGYFFHEWTCKECKTRCPVGHFMVSPCSARNDVVCRSCTLCGRTEYAAAQCTTTRDTICIDVSFPAKILPLNRSYLHDDGIKVSVQHSTNVFLERLVDMQLEENSVFSTTNQQVSQFRWIRNSGLDISVGVTKAFLVPEYRDVSAIDDTKLFNKLQDPTQYQKEMYADVQRKYCRHPIPDYYTLQLEIIKNRTSKAKVVRCDSLDESKIRCPSLYKDGDRYLAWDINTPCAKDGTSKLTPLRDRSNSVVCTEETDLLREIFQTLRPTTHEKLFPSRDCQISRNKCQGCLVSSQCPRKPGKVQERGECCGIPCYSQDYCKKVYSNQCPKPEVECATGEVNIFSLFPVFNKIGQEFSCHLKYKQPEILYQLHYNISIPLANGRYKTTTQQFVVSSENRREHEKKTSTLDFLLVNHNTRMRLPEDLVLLGDHDELYMDESSPEKHFITRQLKTPKELNKRKLFTKNDFTKTAYIQFEKPFLYSSYTWKRNGCLKNMSQIYPNQSIYRDESQPVYAKKSSLEPLGVTDLANHPGFSYLLYRRERIPFLKFRIPAGTSVLTHLQGKSVKGRLVANSLFSRATWHHESATWKLVFAGKQENCPSVISIKVFTQLMTGCAGHFDAFLNCPQDFSMTFNFTTGLSDLPDIFVLQVNDSHTTHNLVVSSIYPPQHVDEQKKGASKLQTNNQLTTISRKKNFSSLWLPIMFIIATTIVILFMVFIYHNCTNRKVKELTEKEKVEVSNNSEADLKKFNGPKHKCIIYIFVGLYVIYSLLFTFSLAFGLIYLTHISVWTNITSPEYMSQDLQFQLNETLIKIKQFEEQEVKRLFKNFEERQRSCIYHLHKENKRLVVDYQETTQKQIDAIFIENGTLHYLSNKIEKQNVSLYMDHINNYVSECNKTIFSVIQRFKANYFQFLKKTAHNDWLKFPRSIFLVQDGDDPDRKFLSSYQVKQFALWLEIEKSEELLMATENVMQRMNRVPTPKITSKETVFPSVVSTSVHTDTLDFLMTPHSFSYTVLPPLYKDPDSNSSIPRNTEFDGLPISTIPSIRKRRGLDDVEFGFSGNLNGIIDDKYLNEKENEESYEIANKEKTQNKNEEKLDSDEFILDEKYFLNDAVYTSKLESEETDIKNDEEEFDKNDKNEFENNNINVEVVKLQPLDNKNLKRKISRFTDNAQKRKDKFDEKKKDKDDNTHLLYIILIIFVVLDIVLLVYRFSWLSSQLNAIKYGYADRIPRDDGCKQVLEIQTAYHLPAFEDPYDENSGYYVDGKQSEIYSSSDRDADNMTFLQPLPKNTDNNILHKIWNEKMQAAESRTDMKLRQCCLVRWLGQTQRMLQRLFLSQLIWQTAVTFLALLGLSLCVYCMEFWLTEQNFQTIVGGQTAAEDIRWQLDTSTRYLHDLATYLTSELSRVQTICDREVNTLTDLFFSTVNMQTSMFTSLLQRLCREAKGTNCDNITAHKSLGGRIVGCNFLPLSSQTYHGLSQSDLEKIVDAKTAPILDLSRRTITIASCLLVSLLCTRLLCQVIASTIRHRLLLFNYLPRVKVYQRENQISDQDEGRSLQHGQSLMDSRESGVYVEEPQRDDAR